MPARVRFRALMLLLCAVLSAPIWGAVTRLQAQDGALDGLPLASAFTLEYPLRLRPAKIVQKFVKPKPNKTPHEGVDLYAVDGAAVRSGAAGKVKKVVLAEDGRGWGAYVRVVTVHNGIKYKVTYANLQQIDVARGDNVTVNTRLGRAAGDYIKLIVQVSEGGMSGFKVGKVLNPKPILNFDGLRLRPVDNSLRVRAEPNTDAAIIGRVNQWDILRTPERAYQALAKAGRANKWLKVTLENGGIGYVAAQYIKVVSAYDPVEGIAGVPIRGMNLDLNQQLGRPPAAPLAQLGWVRINYNVSFNPQNGTHGNTDLAAAYQRYYPMIKQYAESGNKVILVLTHQFYGEGRGYQWEQMNTSQWQQLTAQYAQMAGEVAAQYADEKLVYAYQIWNEQDTLPQNARAAVPMPPADYAHLMTQSILAIRLRDARAKIISGGHITGDVSGVSYARAFLQQMPANVRPDGMAFHPYGVGPAGSPFNFFGVIDDSIKVWSSVLPDTPLWITEWGVLDRQGDDSLAGAVAQHADGFMQVIERRYPGMIAAAVWYAWADGMDNGYGMVNAHNQPKHPLYTSFLGMSDTLPLPIPALQSPFLPPVQPSTAPDALPLLPLPDLPISPDL